MQMSFLEGDYLVSALLEMWNRYKKNCDDGGNASSVNFPFRSGNEKISSLLAFIVANRNSNDLLHRYDDQIITAVMEKLTNGSDGDKHQAMICIEQMVIMNEDVKDILFANKEVVKILTTILKTNGSKRLQEQASSVVYETAIVAPEILQQLVEEERIIPSLVQAIRRGDIKSINMLYLLANYSDEYATLIAEENGLMAVMLAMLSHHMAPHTHTIINLIYLFLQLQNGARYKVMLAHGGAIPHLLAIVVDDGGFEDGGYNTHYRLKAASMLIEMSSENSIYEWIENEMSDDIIDKIKIEAFSLKPNTNEEFMAALKALIDLFQLLSDS